MLSFRYNINVNREFDDTPAKKLTRNKRPAGTTADEPRSKKKNPAKSRKTSN